MTDAKALVPKYNDLMRPTLEALKALGGSASNDELLQWVSEHLNLPDEALDATYEKSEDYIFRDRMSWARSYMRKGGLIENSDRGVWAITPEGRAVTDKALQAVPKQVVSDYYLEKREAAANAPEIEAMDEAGSWQEELLGVLKAMPPEAFERLCQRVLREKGFSKVEVTSRSGDGGIDGSGVLRINLLSFRVSFQAKRWQGSVGAPVVRDFRGAIMGRADKGLIMTTARFTAEAEREATRDGATAIDLIDGNDFCDLLAEIELGVRKKMVPEMSVVASDLAEI